MGRHIATQPPISRLSFSILRKVLLAKPDRRSAASKQNPKKPSPISKLVCHSRSSRRNLRLASTALYSKWLWIASATSGAGFSCGIFSMWTMMRK